MVFCFPGLPAGAVEEGQPKHELDGSNLMVTLARLYKYMPESFIPQFIERGDLLFRNLSYFRQIEERGRSDLLEGLHMDYPDNDITIQTTDGRVSWKGRAAFLNSINTDRLFVFCLSEVLSPALYAEFNADACAEILDTVEFLQRCCHTVSAQPRFAETGLLHDQVEYYAPNKPAKRNVKDPRSIPFFKHEAYSNQHEYRLAVALRNGLKITQRIVNEAFTFDKEVLAGKPAHRHVFIGSIKDIVRVHKA